MCCTPSIAPDRQSQARNCKDRQTGMQGYASHCLVGVDSSSLWHSAQHCQCRCTADGGCSERLVRPGVSLKHVFVMTAGVRHCLFGSWIDAPATACFFTKRKTPCAAERCSCLVSLLHITATYCVFVACCNSAKLLMLADVRGRGPQHCQWLAGVVCQRGHFPLELSSF